MENAIVKQIKPLGFQWETSDPFIFCVHHEDFFKGDTLEVAKQVVSFDHLEDYALSFKADYLFSYADIVTRIRPKIMWKEMSCDTDKETDRLNYTLSQRV